MEMCLTQVELQSWLSLGEKSKLEWVISKERAVVAKRVNRITKKRKGRDRRRNVKAICIGMQIPESVHLNQFSL